MGTFLGQKKSCNTCLNKLEASISRLPPESSVFSTVEIFVGFTLHLACVSEFRFLHVICPIPAVLYRPTFMISPNFRSLGNHLNPWSSLGLIITCIHPLNP